MSRHFKTLLIGLVFLCVAPLQHEARASEDPAPTSHAAEPLALNAAELLPEILSGIKIIVESCDFQRKWSCGLSEKNPLWNDLRSALLEPQKAAQEIASEFSSSRFDPLSPWDVWSSRAVGALLRRHSKAENLECKHLECPLLEVQSFFSRFWLEQALRRQWTAENGDRWEWRSITLPVSFQSWTWLIRTPAHGGFPQAWNLRLQSISILGSGEYSYMSKFTTDWAEWNPKFPSILLQMRIQSEGGTGWIAPVGLEIDLSKPIPTWKSLDCSPVGSNPKGSSHPICKKVRTHSLVHFADRVVGSASAACMSSQDEWGDTVNPCALSEKEQQLAAQIAINLAPLEKEGPGLIFGSGAENPSFFSPDGTLRTAVTGSQVLDPIWINEDGLRDVAEIPTPEDTASLLEEWISLLIHERGHHGSDLSHDELDQFAAKVRKQIRKLRVQLNVDFPDFMDKTRLKVAPVIRVQSWRPLKSKIPGGSMGFLTRQKGNWNWDSVYRFTGPGAGGSLNDFAFASGIVLRHDWDSSATLTRWWVFSPGLPPLDLTDSLIMWLFREFRPIRTTSYGVADLRFREVLLGDFSRGQDILHTQFDVDLWLCHRSSPQGGSLCGEGRHERFDARINLQWWSAPRSSSPESQASTHWGISPGLADRNPL